MSGAAGEGRIVVLREWEVGAWRLRDGNRVYITLRPVFPDGRIFFQPPW